MWRKAIDKYKICDAGQIPTDVVFKESIVDILGKRCAYIENYISIIELSDTNIIVKCKRYYIFIKGNGLHIEYYNNKICMKIIGDLNEISFCRNLH